MSEESSEPAKPSVPPPSIPKPDIPPVVANEGPPPVRVKIRDKDADDSEAVDRHAPINSRIVAAVIDMVLAAGLQITALWILPGFADRIAWLVGFAYIVTRDSLPFLGGQSVGKKVMKLRALTLDDRALTGNWEKALIRNGVLLIPFFALIELIVLLTREDKPERGKRLGDEWAKTKVMVEVSPAVENEAAG